MAALAAIEFVPPKNDVSLLCDASNSAEFRGAPSALPKTLNAEPFEPAVDFDADADEALAVARSAGDATASQCDSSSFSNMDRNQPVVDPFPTLVAAELDDAVDCCFAVCLQCKIHAEHSCLPGSMAAVALKCAHTNAINL